MPKINLSPADQAESLLDTALRCIEEGRSLDTAETRYWNLAARKANEGWAVFLGGVPGVPEVAVSAIYLKRGDATRVLFETVQRYMHIAPCQPDARYDELIEAIQKNTKLRKQLMQSLEQRGWLTIRRAAITAVESAPQEAIIAT